MGCERLAAHRNRLEESVFYTVDVSTIKIL